MFDGRERAVIVIDVESVCTGSSGTSTGGRVLTRHVKYRLRLKKTLARYATTETKEK
jgi:hypothetical protein